MLYIDSISKGIVIDHIRAGNGFRIFKYLGLNNADFRVALIINAQSKKYGKKDLIKVENVMDLDLTMLGFIDPNITINIIEDEKVVKKINLSLPKEVEGIISCKNPRCITSEERHIVHKFILIDEEKGIYKCDYCDQIYSWEG
ncbi:aspartate carbamoyltransferase regulatory subunit [Tepidimicrobium xylanilyticum]|uniref:Aspartate carbamoyltransferase regulatory subunit n=1 Tax=Tepidimicrobium xylanilyticum TaxID=1123352 RepID=A0A1H3BZ80_9FIRM|nr:aspartate carbamoyltransferase regulatory subunit [Tepidimicrobium xylanilyticum]GMG97294.1 aspartate carbamoyltransferase regulatory chain [Tepidimicrobium xylanilyticum]SDX47008.1 aspartate carbamoyltransferase regulatory subunit [Tepidimicrobium xylanilyticum]